MFEVQDSYANRYVVYNIMYERNYTYFLIYRKGRWEFINPNEENLKPYITTH